MTEYFFHERLGEGLIRIYSEKFGFQMFSARKLRKESTCAACGHPLEKGAQAWAEITACAMNRSHRLCDGCVNAGEQRTREAGKVKP